MIGELISIIIPVHNTEAYLKRCVDSVLNQTYKELEIILVENLSADRSAMICEEYAKMDSRVKVLHLNVADLSTARNEGIKFSTGSYIAFVDSDDYVNPEMYEVLMDNLKKHGADISMCTYVLDYESGETETPANSRSSIGVYSGQEAVKGILKEELSNASWDKLYQRRLFDEVLFPERYYYEDHFTMLKWFELCDKIVCIPDVFYHYWQRDDSICHDFNPVRGYHYFLADYNRWEYVCHTGILSGDDRRQFVNRVVYRCYYNFRQIVGSLSSLKDFRDEIKDMRMKLKAYYRENKGMVSFKNRLRLFKTTCLGNLFCFAVFLSRRKP